MPSITTPHHALLPALDPRLVLESSRGTSQLGALPNAVLQPDAEEARFGWEPTDRGWGQVDTQVYVI